MQEGEHTPFSYRQMDRAGIRHLAAFSFRISVLEYTWQEGIFSRRSVNRWIPTSNEERVEGRIRWELLVYPRQSQKTLDSKLIDALRESKVFFSPCTGGDDKQ